MQNDPSLSEVTALLVGAGASVVRAVIMGVLGLFVVQLDRCQDGRKILPGCARGAGVYTLLRADHNGWIEVTMDGVQMWVEK